MIDHDDYRIRNKVCGTGPTAFSARLLLEQIQALAEETQQTGSARSPTHHRPKESKIKTRHNYIAAITDQGRQILTACRERDEALGQVKALQDEVNRLKAELQAERCKRS